MDVHTITIVDGNAEFICASPLESLLSEGTASVRRVSHVEWDYTQQGWTADMSPVGGTVLGAFKTRNEALKAEHNYLVAECNL
jgi:hypothetical protein